MLGINDRRSISSEDYGKSVYSYASCLNKEYSEKSLGLLADTAFSKGLRKGAPEDIEIAHKFGQRDVDGVSLKQLHDCGIVYHPKGPYLICIMTRGNDYEILSEIIGEISKVTYDEYSKELED